MKSTYIVVKPFLKPNHTTFPQFMDVFWGKVATFKVLIPTLPYGPQVLSYRRSAYLADTSKKSGHLL
jgi:hypothetical protein